MIVKDCLLKEIPRTLVHVHCFHLTEFLFDHANYTVAPPPPPPPPPPPTTTTTTTSTTTTTTTTLFRRSSMIRWSMCRLFWQKIRTWSSWWIRRNTQNYRTQHIQCVCCQLRLAWSDVGYHVGYKRFLTSRSRIHLFWTCLHARIMFTNHFEAQAIADVEGFLAVQPHHRSVAQVVGIGSLSWMA